MSDKRTKTNSERIHLPDKQDRSSPVTPRARAVKGVGGTAFPRFARALTVAIGVIAGPAAPSLEADQTPAAFISTIGNDALAEMRRVTRPGGRLVVCEFSRITVEPIDMIYRRYLTGVLPAVARRAARNPEAYEYLAESISDWPAQRELADVIRAAGWSAVRWRDLTLGVVAIHVARNV